MSGLDNDEAAQIRALRIRRGWTQTQLAAALWIDPMTVSRWERGLSHPRRASRDRLRQLGLRRGPNSKGRFIEDPADRIRRLDRARLEQLSFKRRARRIG